MANFTKKHRDDLLNAHIQRMNDMPYRINVSIIASGCCEDCEKRNGEVFSFNELLKDLPLPQKCCTRYNFCICRYGAKGIRDSNGRLISK